ncbi:MAG: hypothetical protein MMC23_008570 [Stictis urceolatum]|nr:hypothetical protein [Stictis urceolata]
MRFLKHNNNGEFTVTSDLVGEDIIPPYAILSHTWREDADEVTFADLRDGASKTKPGYDKIRYCEEQARQDGLQYFWIDTCCIDKANKAELSQAIRSMFRWYRNAARCYVYLSDVSNSLDEDKEEMDRSPWESQFRESRWFTRGWTLQELLAPSSVEFFSREWTKLGDKASLAQVIHEVTGIPQKALHETPLSQFSVDERLRWKEHRQTKLPEDGAYSLLGIFDIQIAPLYGEGSEGALRRLNDEIRRLEDCVQDIRSTDPRDDKRRIEDTKGGLLVDSYRWILENAEFRQWRNDPGNRLLWIKGDPGKGKTMLVCGIVDELQKSMVNTELLSYFFCQATDSRINNATAVLRGLLYLLVSQQPSLVSHIRKRYDRAGKSLFEDANAWMASTEIFADMLRDSSLSPTYLIIDALDECVSDLSKLLDFVIQQSSLSSRVKWIVSSRNWPDIEERLELAGHKVRLSLELNADTVSMAVRSFIEKKVLQLAQQKRYNEQTRAAVSNYLTSNAQDTFLWVAIVCQNLQHMSKLNVLKKLKLFPPGLDSLYEQMMERIDNSHDSELCKQILASITLVYRPITLEELSALVEELEDVAEDQEVEKEIIGRCGSFLTVRNNTVYFVHQSAKDFLLATVVEKLFPQGKGKVHHAIFARSLRILSRTLQRNMHGLDAVENTSDHIRQPDPDSLKAWRYPCVYWIDHLYDSNSNSLTKYEDDFQDGGIVDNFLKEKFLYWLEGLSLCDNLPKGVASTAKLWSLVQGRETSTTFNKLVYDAYRFIMHNKRAIETSPLQAYVSALLCSPTGSLIRGLFQHEEPKWITIKPVVHDGWSACLQTLEGHSESVGSVAFSHDSTRLASASFDRTVKIWDTSSGACLQTLEGHNGSVESVAFSHDSTRLASASGDMTVKIWDTSSGACLQTLEGHNGSVNSVAFSHDSTRLASASFDRTVKIWDTSSGACLQTLEGHNSYVNSVAFSHDSTRLASGSEDETVKIWDTSSGACLQTLLVGRIPRKISFDPTSSYLLTDSSTIAISPSSLSNATKPAEPRHAQFQGGGVSEDKTWIMYNNKKMLWLPSEYRPSCSSALGNKVAIGVSSGRVWICSFHLGKRKASNDT